MSTTHKHDAPEHATHHRRADALESHPTDPRPTDDGGALVRSYLAALAANSPTLTARFARQCTDAHADALAAKTRAVNVLHESERMAQVIHATLAEPRRGGLAYTPARFRYLLERTAALRESIAHDAAAQSGTGAAHQGAQAAHDAAVHARDALIERLEACARGDVKRVGALADARGDIHHDDGLIDSLKALAKLAHAWRGAEGSEDRELADASSLDEGSIAAVAAAQTDLARAHRDAGDVGPHVVRDSPATNRVEGQVLAELRLAIDQFDGAHSRDRTVPRLVPGRGTRQALGSHGSTHEASAPTDGATGSGAGAAPAGGGAPAA